ncbi:hypothetical protein ACVWXO_008254 [Bradyrhizobium sp. LM2.7]
MSGGGYSLLESALAVRRSRTSWNGWLAQAERPASDHEEDKIQRVASMVRGIVGGHQPLVAELLQVMPQGSYFNNTNVRQEADMDLRLQLPGIRSLYSEGVSETDADVALGLVRTGVSFEHTAMLVRAELGKILVRQFGHDGVDLSGKKAIKVHGLDGSRTDCDIVPAFRLNFVGRNYLGQIFSTDGVAILGTDGSFTYNFPEQHHKNGVTERTNTAHRFKRNVRMLKRLNYELEEVGDIQKRLPSFLVECLVYRVEDPYFLVEADDRYDRLLRILGRLHDRLGDDAWTRDATEVNDVKYLFREGQAWTLQNARQFVAAAVTRLVA